MMHSDPIIEPYESTSSLADQKGNPSKKKKKRSRDKESKVKYSKGKKKKGHEKPKCQFLGKSATCLLVALSMFFIVGVLMTTYTGLALAEVSFGALHPILDTKNTTVLKSSLTILKLFPQAKTIFIIALIMGCICIVIAATGTLGVVLLNHSHLEKKKRVDKCGNALLIIFLILTTCLAFFAFILAVVTTWMFYASQVQTNRGGEDCPGQFSKNDKPQPFCPVDTMIHETIYSDFYELRDAWAQTQDTMRCCGYVCVENGKETACTAQDIFDQFSVCQKIINTLST